MGEPVARVIRSCGLDEAAVLRHTGLPSLDGVVVAPAPRWLRSVWGGETAGVTLGRRILVRPSLLGGERGRLARLILHELVHVGQWMDAGAARFLGRYLSGYLAGRLGGAGHREAYRAIPYEVEARMASERFEIV